MNKKYFSFIFVLALFLPCMFLLSACGEPAFRGLYVKDTNSNQIFSSYSFNKSFEYGTYTNDILSDKNFQIVAKYQDDTTSVLTANDYTVKYLKNGESVEQLAQQLDVGGYEVIYTFEENYSVSVYFSIEPSSEPYYSITLSQTSWDYDEEPASITLNCEQNLVDCVDYYYIEKEVYDKLSAEEKKSPVSQANLWSDYAKGIDAGQYYVFAIITFNTESNYSPFTVIDNSVLITVNKAVVNVTQEDLNGVQASYNYNDSGNSGVSYKLGNITLNDVFISPWYVTVSTDNESGIETSILWENPEQELNSNNSGESFAVKLGIENENYIVPVDLSLEVYIEKGESISKNNITMTFETTGTNEIVYNGEAHNVLVGNFEGVFSGGKIFDYIALTDKNGENVNLVYEDVSSSAYKLYISGLTEVGEYKFTFSIIDENYTWSDRTTDAVEFTLYILENTDVLDVIGSYITQDYITDAEKPAEEQPQYLVFMNNWMNTNMKTVAAKGYNGNIKITYNSESENKNIVLLGEVYNQYSDNVDFSQFETNTTLNYGQEKYTIDGTINTNGGSTYTVKKGDDIVDYLIDENFESFVLTTLYINIVNTSMEAGQLDSQSVSVATGDDNVLKIKIEMQVNDGSGNVVCYYVFNNDGTLVGYQVSFEASQSNMSYSVQFAFTENQTE